MPPPSSKSKTQAEKKENEPSMKNRQKDAYLWNEGVGKLGELGPTGAVGVPESASLEDLKNEQDAERRELAATNPSDLNDPGDPEAGDVGLPGGAGSGGEMSEGGSGGGEREHDEELDWKNDEDDPAKRQGTGAEENFGGDTKKSRKG